MYFRDGEISAFGDDRDRVILRPSQRFQYRPQVVSPLPSTHLASFPTYYGLGEPPAPKGLKLFDHFQVPKKPDPANAGQFVTGAVTKLSVTDLNPGFIDASDNLITDTSSAGLQTCLQKLITAQFRNYLSKASNTTPSAGDRLRVGLVDLTGNKITKPDFAGWGPALAMYGASVPKILAVYAAFQLREDLRNLATTQSITNGKDLEKEAYKRWTLTRGGPNLRWLFDILKWSGIVSGLDFSAAARTALAGIKDNGPASRLIVGVGFPHIASLTWQSGLHHPTRGGLWLSSSYNGQVGSNPVRAPFSANVTALSVATFFTLLAQGRLVNDVASTEMKTTLLGGCRTKHFPLLAGRVAMKCGVWGGYWHDCVLIDRPTARYVVVGLSKTNRSEFGKYTQLFNELDNLIVRNNQSPKPGC